MTRKRSDRLGAVLPAMLLALIPAAAGAVEFGLRLEPGFAIPADSPQSDLLRLGLTIAVKGVMTVHRYVDVQAGVTYLGLGAGPAAPSTDIGSATGIGAGLRVHTEHRAGPSAIPWIDGDVMYVRTGPLDRFGFAIGAGFDVPVDARRRYLLGPFLRYLQIVDGNRAGFDSTDAKILLIGLSLGVGPAHTAPACEIAERVVCPPGPVCAADVTTDRDGDGVPDGIDKCPDSPGPKATFGCPDRDGDGLADIVDLCPDVAGPVSSSGCPPYQRVVIKKDKLELDEGSVK